MIGLTALLGLAIASAVGGIVSSSIQSATNYKSQKETNESNEKLQRETNAQAQYNAEHAHQMEVKDLAAAGLNPVLSAGGSGAPQATLNSPKASAPQIDLSGIQSALAGLTNTMMMATLLNEKNHILEEQTAIMRQNANSISANSASYNALNKARGKFYDTKASSLAGKASQVGQAYAHSADSLRLEHYSNAKPVTKKAWEKLVKEIENWKKK